MARQTYQFAVTVPKSTAKTSPYTGSMDMPACVVRKVTVETPSGANGNVGYALGVAGTPVIPINAGAYIVTTGTTLSWQPRNAPDQGQWQLIAYNTGSYDHTLQVTFEVDPAAEANAPAYPQPVSVSSSG